MRSQDRGSLWEHYVLNEYLGRRQQRDLLYWRDKRGHAVDFVTVRRGKPVAIECRWRADGFGPRNLRAFRKACPAGENFVVTPDTERSCLRRDGDVQDRSVGLGELVTRSG